jgi:DNA-directed RNA polymerase specialized sigma24 family protein
LPTQPEIDFGGLAVRLTSYGLRVFAEFGLGGRSAVVPGVGLSAEDFASKVLLEYAEGTLAYKAERGELFSLLASALRNDIIDALRKAAHRKEEIRSPLARENRSEEGPPSLDELPAPGGDTEEILAAHSYQQRLLETFRDEPELAAVVKVVFDLDLAKPREIAASLGISITEYQNRKKRLRRRLMEGQAVEVSEA